MNLHMGIRAKFWCHEWGVIPRKEAFKSPSGKLIVQCAFLSKKPRRATSYEVFNSLILEEVRDESSIWIVALFKWE